MIARLRLTLASLLVFACYPCAAGGGSRPAPVATLPFETAFDSIVLLRGSVNGQTAWLLFDTGGHAVLNARWTRAHGLNAVGDYQASGSGPNMARAAMLRGARWRLGGSQFIADSVVVDLSELESVFGRPIDGIVGTELLRRYVVEVDYQRRQLRIYARPTYRPPAHAQALPLAFDRNGYSSVEAELSFPDKTVRGRFMIDSGSNGEVDLYQPFTARNHLLENRTVVDEVSTGIGGEQHDRMTRARALQIGKSKLPAPVLAFSEDADSFSARNYAGLIGAEVLHRFLVAFDFRGGKMYLVPGSHFHDPSPYDASGLRLRAMGRNFETLRVARIIKASPAEQAGILVDDVLISVNGTTALSLEKVRQWFCRPDQKYHLRIRRAGRIKELDLHTEPIL